MKQINIRVTDEEYAILELISKRKGIPVTSIFKSSISSAFDDWKISSLLKLYSEGNITFKDIVKLSGWSYAALIRKFAESDMEPPKLDIAELNAEKIVANANTSALFKKPIS